MHHLLRYFLSAVVITGLAAILRRIAVAWAWELPSQIGTMILFAPLLACIASVAWQPYSSSKRLKIPWTYQWIFSIAISVCFFFLWNWIFHDGVFDREALEANAYHWIVFFCVAWISLRTLAAISSSWFIPRFKPDSIQLIDLFIGTSLAAIVMACFRVVPTVGVLSNLPAVTQFVHAAWGALMFSILWVLLSWAIGKRNFRVCILMGIIAATAGARIASPYATAQFEGFWTDRKIVLVQADSPAFQKRSTMLPFMPKWIGDRRIWTEARVVNFPGIEERLIEAMTQVASILVVISLTTAKPVRIDATKSDSQTTNPQSPDSWNPIDGLPDQS